MLYSNWRKLIFVPVAFFLYFSGTFSQAPGEIERTMDFDGSDVQETMIIEVGNDVASLGAVLRGEITTGSLVVSIIDPKGKKRNAFSLDCAQNGEGQYEVHSISSGAVVTVVKGEKGKNHVITETEDGGKSVIITSDGSGSSSVMQIESGDSKYSVKMKEKEKDKTKNRNSNSNTNSNSDDGQNGVVVTSYDESGAKGVFVESIEDPRPGQWKVIVEGKKVKGTLNVVVNKG